MKQWIPANEFNERFDTMVKVMQHTPTWTENIAAYYAIRPEEVKGILMRLMFDGSGRPDPEWEPTKGTDSLPCLLELRNAMDEGWGVEAA